MNKSTLVIALVLIASACLKVQTTGKKSKYYETFLLQEGGTQYFIKPVLIKNAHATLSLDYTLRDNATEVTCNFTLTTTLPLKQLKTLDFDLSGNNISTKALEKIFIEKTKNYNYRYSSKITYQDFKRTMSEPLTSITLSDGEQRITIVPTSSFKKVAEVVRNNIIDVIELQKPN